MAVSGACARTAGSSPWPASAWAQPGYVEVSGVCTHPDARGRGLARLLSRYVAGRIAAAGDRPYLHAFATNTPAIRLYESIGFVLRKTMQERD